MARVQSVILPATLICCLFIIIAISNLASPASLVEAAPIQASYPTGTLSGQYPANILQWQTLIEQYAAENELDANLVAAVMLQESGGNALAYSRSGAVGLMQVMPRDGLAASFQCANGPCFASRPTMAELYDPEFNISYACRFLSSLISRTGDLREALKSYGPADIGYRYADIVLAIYERYS